MFKLLSRIVFLERLESSVVWQRRLCLVPTFLRRHHYAKLRFAGCLIVCVFIFTLDAKSQLADLSSGLSKTQSQRASQPKQKAHIPNLKPREIRSAVLWQAPPFDSLSPKLSTGDELSRDELAIQYLIEGAIAQNENLALAQKTISKKEPLVFRFGKMTAQKTLDINNLRVDNLILNSRSKEESLDLINKYGNYIYENYQIFKSYYKPCKERDMRVISQALQAREKLELVSGAEALNKVVDLQSRFL